MITTATTLKVNIITILLLKLLLSVYPFCVKYSKNTPKFSILNTNLGAKTTLERRRKSFSSQRQREFREPLETKSYLLHTHVCIQSVICALALVLCASSSLKLIKSSIF